MLPPRITKDSDKRKRWRSPAHTSWVRGFHCAVCSSATNIAAAHVRLGSHTGMGQKPDDWRTVPLCDGPHSNIDGHLGCHNRQHIVGEKTFWQDAGVDPEKLIEALCKASPRKADIVRGKRERGYA